MNDERLRTIIEHWHWNDDTPPTSIISKIDKLTWDKHYNGWLEALLRDENVEDLLIKVQSLDTKNQRLLREHVNAAQNLSDWALEEIKDRMTRPEARIRQLWTDVQDRCTLAVGKWETTRFDHAAGVFVEAVHNGISETDAEKLASAAVGLGAAGAAASEDPSRLLRRTCGRVVCMRGKR